eukprot:TRINITY_DN21889_c0_g1_i1.p1 TRINITY_DN21889_c0_g1~~TRINITY_DN21889_c0_g1_i1.p1  ORF type:complete len:302 (+),score=115.93 TRINITY_DN21889_c0_g1_i1:67-972(+)
MSEEEAKKSVFGFGLRVLQTHDAGEKAELTIDAYEAWQDGELELYPGSGIYSVEDGKEEERLAYSDVLAKFAPPDVPARPKKLTVVDGSEVGKRGKGGTVANRVKMIHSLAHIEAWAIDLSWDILLRFSCCDDEGVRCMMPVEFYEDWLIVAWDEARHYSVWATRLEELGSEYGALKVHDGLWESATQTAKSLEDRLSIVHMVHEARGLDVAPKTVNRFRSHGDMTSADHYQAIFEDEITHVTAGVKWFSWLCKTSNVDPITRFHKSVRANFRGVLKPPFNDEARAKAGFTKEWYMPLTTK